MMSKKIAMLWFVLALTACAGIDYVKVPTPTQYESWTDQQQRAADAMEGVRYYLPRPFLHLKTSIPVAQRVAFISVVFKDGAYEVQLPDDPPTWLQRVAPKSISVTAALAASLASPAPGAAKQQEGKVGEPKPEGEKPPSTLKARTGFINATDPITRLGDKMDVVYLPDFEEQYVIQPSGGLGTADVETRLRNGWAAEVFSQQVDNSNLIPYVLKQIESASDVAAGIATTWALKTTTGVAPADLQNVAGMMQAGKVDAEAVKDLLGNVLLLKIVEVKVAQPGLYPILKPREVRQWLRSAPAVVGDDPQATFELYLQQANLPWIRPDMAFIPCPPFTMIGFNVTTDVYLAPAGERAEVRGGGGSEPSRKDDAVAKAAGAKVIVDALVAASRESGAEITGLSAQNITVTPKDSGTTSIALKRIQAFEEDKIDAYKTWIRSTLKFEAGDPAIGDWKAELTEPEKKTLTVEFRLSASAVQQRLQS